MRTAWPGLAAAKQLVRRGHRVVVVEGHGRPGGRVYTKKMQARCFWPICAVAELQIDPQAALCSNPGDF